MDQKIVVVTGANRGIGYGLGAAFNEEGHTVLAINRTLCGENWMEEYECDLTNKDQVNDAINSIIEKYGRIDILVNNAGIRRYAPIDEISERDWNDSLLTNVTAPLWLIQKCTPLLSASNGLLLFVGSQAAEYPFVEGIAYSTTKAAFLAMSRIAIQDLRYRGIRVCYLSLGAVANRPKENDEWKIRPSDVGELALSLSKLSPRVMPTYVELRPAAPNTSAIPKMQELQNI
ncbi:SDR family NAD(P)-dependent oxidoreductase [Paenibacillus aquistagni]|uniref:SDR family NAD(P)-dependent oxidoreductase n=1 Tax=Paenibacillus aquistagni TaxID=1852522 RepID=UPI00145ACC00|nr:SDR family NAD(P)-dependent oxidoreductase [Paenibacillus aquistagni]NMM53334.1 SDR family NAD(P)-dependent oxidoreductase [Paenibacillus aquistagni]